MAGTKIGITTPDGTMDAYAFRPSSPTPGELLRPVVFLMDGIGPREELHRMAERVAERGYYVLFPNFFYRYGAYAPFDPKTVFQDAPERERLISLIRGVTHELAMRDVGAVLAALDKAPGVQGDQVGLVGYCFGGRTAMRAAGCYPERVVAAASIHGAGLATDREDSPHLLADRIRAKLYIGIAELDQGFSKEEAERLRAALEAAKVSFTMEVYPGVQHGFAVGDLPVYDAPAAEKHWERVFALFKETLG